MESLNLTKCTKAIAAKGWNIAFIESATAGRMCSEFSLTSESGKILRGGICCYEIFVKEQILKVPHQIITDYTAESAQATQKLAQNGSHIFNSDITVACTGLTTAGGSETEDKPVGTMFLHIITPKGVMSHSEVYQGNAAEIVLQTIQKTADLIYLLIEK